MSERAILLDAQLLVLLLVGVTSKSLIAKHKRLTAYTASDFELLEQILRRAQKVIATPNAFTEASNLARQIAEPHRSEIGETFQRLADSTDETYVPTSGAVQAEEFVALGLADAVMLQTDADATLLTADLDLFLAARKRGLKAMNFNHMRVSN